MRKLLRVWSGLLGAAAVLLCAGCGRAAEEQPPSAQEIASVFSDAFTAQAEMTVGLSEDDSETLALTATVTRSGDCCAVEVTAPEHLEGLTFQIDSLSEQKLTVRYKGLEIQPNAMPGSNLGSMLAGALDALASPEELTVTETEQGWCVTGQTQAGSFSMLLDSESHLPLSLTLPEARIGCSFTDFEAMSVFRPDRIEEDFAPSSEEPTSEEPASEESSSEPESGEKV
jgi:hypothetical protein